MLEGKKREIEKNIKLKIKLIAMKKMNSDELSSIDDPNYDLKIMKSKETKETNLDFEKITQTLNLTTKNFEKDEDYIKALNQLIKDSRIPDISNLRGIFSFDIEDNLEYQYGLKMKEKLPILRKLKS